MTIKHVGQQNNINANETFRHGFGKPVTFSAFYHGTDLPERIFFLPVTGSKSPSLTHLVQGCLKMDPAERLTCEQLLQQPYFDSLRHKSENSSREQQERNKRSRFPRRHLPPGVKSCPGAARAVRSQRERPVIVQCAFIGVWSLNGCPCLEGKAKCIHVVS